MVDRVKPTVDEAWEALAITSGRLPADLMYWIMEHKQWTWAENDAVNVLTMFFFDNACEMEETHGFGSKEANELQRAEKVERMATNEVSEYEGSNGQTGAA